MVGGAKLHQIPPIAWAGGAFCLSLATPGVVEEGFACFLMPTIRKTKFRPELSFFGKLTIHNVLDWLVTAWLLWILWTAVSKLGGTGLKGVMIGLSKDVGILLFLHGCWWVARPREECRVIWAGLLFFPFVAFAAVSTYFLTPTPWVGREDLVLWAQGAAIFWVAVHNMRTREHILVVLGGLLALALMTMTAALYQSFNDPGWLPMGRFQEGQYVVDRRASGTFGAPNSLAGFVLLLFPMALVAAFSNRASAPVRVLLFLVAACCASGVVLAISRGGIIVLVVIFLILPYFLVGKLQNRILGFALVPIMLILAGSMIYISSPNLQDRIARFIAEGGEVTRKHLFKASWEIFQEHPVLGSGAGSFDMHFEKYRPPTLQRRAVHTHNDYLNTLSDYGLVGFALLFGPVAYIYWRGWRSWRKLPFTARLVGEVESVTPLSKIVLGGLLCGLLAFYAHLFVEFHLKVAALLYTVMIAMAIVVKFSIGKAKANLGNVAIRPLILGSSLALGGFIAMQGWVSYNAAAAYQRAQERIRFYWENVEERRGDMRYLRPILFDLRETVNWEIEHADAWASLAQMNLQRFHQAPHEAKILSLESEAMVRRALRVHEAEWHYHAIYAQALAVGGGSPARVIREYERAVELAPNSARAWFLYAQYLATVPSRRTEANEAVTKVLELDPQNGKALALQAKLKLN